MNKVLVRVFFPRINEWYEIWIPLNQKISSIIVQLLKGINELNNEDYKLNDLPVLYNRATGEYYDFNIIVENTNIRNGTELILM